MSFFNFFNKQDSSSKEASAQDEKLARHKERVAAFNHFCRKTDVALKSDPILYMLLGVAFMGAADAVDSRKPDESLEQAKIRAIEDALEIIKKNSKESGDTNLTARRFLIDLAVVSVAAAGADWAATNPIKK